MTLPESVRVDARAKVNLYLKVLMYMMLMNVGLGLFNLLPIPPLDGSHVLENLLPPRASGKYREWSRYGPFFLIGIILLDNFAHTGILTKILLVPMLRLCQVFGGENFFRLLMAAH